MEFSRVVEPPDLDALRAREFPFSVETTYLNAAAVGPLSESARRATEAYVAARARVHTLGAEHFDGVLRACRQAAARLVGAAPEEIALGGNTSYGLNLAALGLPLRPGSTAVVSDREFPANVYPWMRLQQQGVALEIVPTDARGLPDEARLLERLTRGDVSLFALSAVQFATGYLADVRRFGEICREYGVFFVVDAIQALGQLPLDVKALQIDVLACGGHKWLCGPFGTGFAYVRDELIERLEPHAVGWSSMRASQDFGALLDYRYDFVDDARRFEVATLPLQDFAALAASLELLLGVGVERIRAHVAALLEPLVAWLAERPAVEIVSDLRPEHRSGIFCFRPRDAQAAFAALRRADVHAVLREGAIRLSPHLYNTPADLERVLGVLAELEPA